MVSKADWFNNYFVSVFTQENSNVPTTDGLSFPDMEPITICDPILENLPSTHK